MPLVIFATIWLSARFTRFTDRPWFRPPAEFLRTTAHPARGPDRSGRSRKTSFAGPDWRGRRARSCGTGTGLCRKAQRRIDKSTFDSLRKLLVAHPEVSSSEFKKAVREQWAILALDEAAAIKALPQLLPVDATAQRAFRELIQATAASLELKPEGQRRLKEVLRLLSSPA